MSADSGTRPRDHSLDNLRTALVVLVVLHHVAVVYSAATPFYYVEPPYAEPLAGAILLHFMLLNQAWFMGALFFLAGYFTPAAVDRKGVAGFVAGRLLRLGIPVLFGIFVISPLSGLGYWLMPPELTGITTPPSWSSYPKLLGLGAMWFALMLLIFDLGYALVRAIMPGTGTVRPLPAGWTILAVAIVLAAVTYAFRTLVPFGESVSLVLPFLDFPTLAYLPQYLGFFAAGCLAGRSGWVAWFPGLWGVVGGLCAVAAFGLLYPLAISGTFWTFDFTTLAAARGDGTWSSALYATWDSVTAVGLTLGALVLFRRFVAGSGKVSRFLAAHSYAAYVVHIPVVVFLTYALRDVPWPLLAKAGLAALIILPATFGVAFLVRKLPGVARVL